MSLFLLPVKNKDSLLDHQKGLQEWARVRGFPGIGLETQEVYGMQEENKLTI